MLLAETLEGWRRSRPAVHRPIRLSEPAASVQFLLAVWLFLPYEYYYYEYNCILTIILVAVCPIISGANSEFVGLLTLKRVKANTILDISADHVRVKIRCYDLNMCQQHEPIC